MYILQVKPTISVGIFTRPPDRTFRVDNRYAMSTSQNLLTQISMIIANMMRLIFAWNKAQDLGSYSYSNEGEN